jgi:hypothetical protein
MGLQGLRGLSGAAGPHGERGEKGEPGNPGKLQSIKGEWAAGVFYAGDVVTFRGGTYQAKADTANSPEHADWVCIAAAGVDGRSFTIRGTYSRDDKYKVLDVVTLDSSWFIARVDNPGVCPGPDWKLGPTKGKKGDRGERGERGLSGTPGARGEPGEPGLEIIAWEIANYSAIPLMSDGSKGPVLSLRGLLDQFNMEAR